MDPVKKPAQHNITNPREPSRDPIVSARHPASLEQLQHQIAKQNLLIQSLVRLLIEKEVLTEAEFSQYVEWFDTSDGQRDGELTESHQVKICDSCKRANTAWASQCQFCGCEFKIEYLTQP